MPSLDFMQDKYKFDIIQTDFFNQIRTENEIIDFESPDAVYYRQKNGFNNYKPTSTLNLMYENPEKITSSEYQDFRDCLKKSIIGLAYRMLLFTKS